jgi:hypothetical protein
VCDRINTYIYTGVPFQTTSAQHERDVLSSPPPSQSVTPPESRLDGTGGGGRGGGGRGGGGGGVCHAQHELGALPVHWGSAPRAAAVAAAAEEEEDTGDV